MKNKAALHEPHPIKGKTVVPPHVIQDLKDRAKVGKTKYGTMLKTENGRDTLMDAYQEALNLVMYLRQAILKRKK
ncbi:MAG TPA: hypothetical protein ENI08_02855 [Candidatus Dependentiae bacterium]|nr:hypothetical protein [Candidatus Dependentiae bacterium]